jgi:phosphoadenosine phosphosulfate reductase
MKATDTNKIRSMLKKSEKLAEIYGCKLNLGFSGGKDSVVLKYFADRYGIDYAAHFNNTQIEQYKGMIQFIKSNYPDVKIVHPDRKNSFFELMKTGGLPSIFRRWCCEYLKHSSPKLAEYRVNIMGIRGEESLKRLERGEISVFGKSKRAAKKLAELKKTFAGTDCTVSCEGGKDRVNIYPIFDLTEKDVFDIIRAEKLVIPEVYYSKCSRLGCAFCPFASRKENYESIKEHPAIAKAWLRVLSDETFQKERQRNIVGKTDGAGLFYLYVNRSLLTDDLLKKGLGYLNRKDLFGRTGLQNFKDYLEQCKIIKK